VPAKKKAEATKTVPLRITKDVQDFYERVSKLSGLSINTVLIVVICLAVQNQVKRKL
jgi:hypothetical protein